jgi:bacterioferritin (cytochrome b1)
MMEEIVVNELTGLRKAESALESLYTELPAKQDDASLRLNFLRYLAGLEERANRLERLLDAMGDPCTA